MLKDLGLDVYEIKEAVINSAVGKLLDEIGRDLRKDIQRAVRDQIAEKVNEIVGEALADKFQPIDDFGDPTGDETTIRELFKKEVITWWGVKVDKNGEPSRSYDAKKRAEVIAELTIEKIVRGELKGDFVEIVKEIKAQTKESITEIIQAKVNSAWSKRA